MDYRSLGRTGVKVSPLCLGCMFFGQRTPKEHALEIIDHAIDSGINFLDTANIYGRGTSEQVLGEALKKNKKRNHIVLATKVHVSMDDNDPNMQGNSRRHIIQQCEASLRRLGTDWIDLYQIHRPQSDIPMDEMLRALDDLITSGKVRYIGTSTFAAWQLVESLWISDRLGLNRFVSEQPPYNLLDRRVERELIPMALTHGFAIIPWSPLAGGLLTGKYLRGKPAPKDSRYENKQDNSRINDRMFDVVEGISELAEMKKCTTSQLALAWLVNQPGMTCPIIGPRTVEQLKDNLKAREVEITDEDRRRIDKLIEPGTFVSSYYNADFGPHRFSWF